MFGIGVHMPDRAWETKEAKGSVMTVQVKPAETETDRSSTNKNKNAEQRTGFHNLINLWDERTAADKAKLDKPWRNLEAG